MNSISTNITVAQSGSVPERIAFGSAKAQTAQKPFWFWQDPHSGKTQWGTLTLMVALATIWGACFLPISNWFYWKVIEPSFDKLLDGKQQNESYDATATAVGT